MTCDILKYNGKIVHRLTVRGLNDNKQMGIRVIERQKTYDNKIHQRLELELQPGMTSQAATTWMVNSSKRLTLTTIVVTAMEEWIAT